MCLDSRHLRGVTPKFGGALALHVSENGDGSVLWAHTSESMSIGYMNISDSKPKVRKLFFFLRRKQSLSEINKCEFYLIKHV